MEKTVNIPGIGEFKERYQLLSSKMPFELLGDNKEIEVRFNVIDTKGQVTDRQIKAFKNFKANVNKINQNLQVALKAYKAKHNINETAKVTLMSIVFDSTEDYILLDTSWDPEEGLAAKFDLQSNIHLVSQDDVL